MHKCNRKCAKSSNFTVLHTTTEMDIQDKQGSGRSFMLKGWRKTSSLTGV